MNTERLKSMGCEGKVFNPFFKHDIHGMGK
jgi:hypothetical protein